MTSEQGLKAVDEVKDLVKGGLTTKDALTKLKLSQSQYYYYRKKHKKNRAPRKLPELLTIPLEDKLPLVVLLGHPSDVNAALERLARIHGGAR